MQFKGEGQAVHTIENPGQVVFIILLILAVFIALSLSVGFLFKN